MIRVCDVCDQELVPFAGTWICPDGLKDLPEDTEAKVVSVLRNSGPDKNGGMDA